MDDILSEIEKKNDLMNSLARGFMRVSGSGRITPNDPSNLNIPWVVEANFELDPLINLPGPSAFVVPVGIAPGSINLLARQTLRDDRQFPYRCQDESHSQTTYITLPTDVTVNRLPEDVALEAEGPQYRSLLQTNWLKHPGSASLQRPAGQERVHRPRRGGARPAAQNPAPRP